MSLKFDSGKWRLSLIPVSALRAIAAVLDYGATKYTHEVLPDIKILRNKLCEKLVNVPNVVAKNVSLQKDFVLPVTVTRPCTSLSAKTAENYDPSNLRNNCADLATKEIVSAQDLKNLQLNVSTKEITEMNQASVSEKNKENMRAGKIHCTDNDSKETLFLGTWLDTAYQKHNISIFWQKVAPFAEAKNVRTWTMTIPLENSEVCFVASATKDSDCFRMILILCEMLWNTSLNINDFTTNVSGADNWKTVPDARRRYYDAAIRHLTAWWDGERNDPESNLPHLAHAACCIIFLLWLDDNPQTREHADNDPN